MRVVEAPEDEIERLLGPVPQAEAKAAFGNRTRCTSSASSQGPRHIEVQVLADTHGNACAPSARATARCSAATRR